MLNIKKIAAVITAFASAAAIICSLPAKAEDTVAVLPESVSYSSYTEKIEVPVYIESDTPLTSTGVAFQYDEGLVFDSVVMGEVNCRSSNYSKPDKRLLSVVTTSPDGMEGKKLIYTLVFTTTGEQKPSYSINIFKTDSFADTDLKILKNVTYENAKVSLDYVSSVTTTVSTTAATTTSTSLTTTASSTSTTTLTSTTRATSTTQTTSTTQATNTTPAVSTAQATNTTTAVSTTQATSTTRSTSTEAGTTVTTSLTTQSSLSTDTTSTTGVTETTAGTETTEATSTQTSLSSTTAAAAKTTTTGKFSGTASLSIGTYTAKPGETIKVPVTIESSEGYAISGIYFEYDNQLSPLRPAKGLASFLGSTFRTDYTENTDVISVTTAETENITENGIVYYLVFKVAQNIYKDTELAITPTVRYIYDVNGNKLSMNAVAGGIVKVDAPDDVDLSSLSKRSDYGDVNLDGDVSLADIVVLQKAQIGLAAITASLTERADCCKDGSIDYYDIFAIMYYLTDKIESLPVEEFTINK